MNEDKCHLLITNQGDGCISARIGKENIANSKSEKLLGIIIDSKLNFNEHISILCKKVNFNPCGAAHLFYWMHILKYFKKHPLYVYPHIFANNAFQEVTDGSFEN